MAGTDEEYINHICDYNENAEHDDFSDSLSSIIRKLWNKKETGESNYTPIFMYESNYGSGNTMAR